MRSAPGKQRKQRTPRWDLAGDVEVHAVMLKAVMAARGVTAADLARGTGMSLRSVQNIMGGIRRLKGRRLVEDFLQTPIWSSLDEFNARQSGK
jgi:hypothetical protein